MRWRILLACALTICTIAEAGAVSRRRRCRLACRAAINACVVDVAAAELRDDLGERARRRAVRQLHRRCRGSMMAACRRSPAVCSGGTTTSTAITTPTTTSSSSTTLPSPGTGRWRFVGDGTETCSAFDPHVEVSFEIERSGATLSGTWFADRSAAGRGRMTRGDGFTFALDGTARHFPCVITALVLDGEALARGARATLTATADCSPGPCGGEWTGTLEN